MAGIDLDVAEGEFVVLLGPSGCGKTTTLRCIAGLEDVSGGSIEVGGHVVSEPDRSVPPERRQIGMVFQSYAIWPHMTVAQNVTFGLKLQKLPAEVVSRRLRSALELVGLEDYAERHVSQLSGGQQQRVALARAVALEPKVLLFDEPLSNLDAKLRERMRFELRQLQQRLGITSIYVTHDQQEAMVVADRIVLMNKGEVEQIGPPVELYKKPRSRFSAEFVGLTNILGGRVLASGGRTTVEIAPGWALEAEAGEFRPGDAVDVIFRPEDIQTSLNPLAGPNGFPARVKSSFFLGNVADLTLETHGIELRGQLSPPQLWESGREIFARVDPAALVLLRR
ncbi:ABC transporter ATP-binding protein [Alsobacter sp. SYSU M60028]|uniref:ABC transporter ATP-binding protein n=1 Tax=Alsobacter ponti TaxID=2962936 RepID=A0ABT1LCT5_9HYPH|nr:ABC transporter ATP-binding protein [Alsobacter ponti]